MPKLNFIQRLFWSSEKIKNYFLENTNINNEEFKSLIDAQKLLIDEQKARILDKDKIIGEIKEKLIREEEISKNASFQTNELKEKIHVYESKRFELEKELNIVRNEKNEISKKINSKLETLTKIETTFFGKTGNKGKGMLGEMQLSKLLEVSGLPQDFYVNNLQVNSNIVEFAIKSGIKGKWIPVDSKVIDVDIDDNQVIIITDKYIAKVKNAVKEISKYLSKSNTTDYGLLVIQSDEIYMKLYEYNPAFFQNMIRDYKIHISSPSSFINYSSSISHILDIYSKVHNEEKLYKEIIALMETTRKFADNMQKSYKTFKVAMESHYPALENKHKKIKKTIDTNEQFKAIKSLEEN